MNDMQGTYYWLAGYNGRHGADPANATRNGEHRAFEVGHIARIEFGAGWDAACKELFAAAQALFKAEWERMQVGVQVKIVDTDSAHLNQIGTIIERDSAYITVQFADNIVEKFLMGSGVDLNTNAPDGDTPAQRERAIEGYIRREFNMWERLIDNDEENLYAVGLIYSK